MHKNMNNKRTKTIMGLAFCVIGMQHADLKAQSPWDDRVRSPYVYGVAAHLWDTVQMETPMTWDVSASVDLNVEMSVSIDSQLWTFEDYIWEPNDTTLNSSHTFEGYDGGGSSYDVDISRTTDFPSHFEPGFDVAGTYVHWYAGGSGAWAYADSPYDSYRVDVYMDPAPYFVGY